MWNCIYFVTILYFGQITILSTDKDKNVFFFSLNRPNISLRELLDEPELVATPQTGCENLYSVTCLNENSVWTFELTNEIKWFNIKDSILQTVRIISGKWPNETCVDKNGNLLYSDARKKTVNKVKNRQTNEFIKLKE